MAVTQRLRFEVLKRDNHSCQYCGATAPGAKLVVDHVVPKALGGTDEVTNLVTACQPCNTGKSSVDPGAPLVAAVKADALRHAAVVQAAYAVLVERLGLQREYLDEVGEAYTKDLPESWEVSVGRWYDMGVPVEIIVDAATKACAKFFSTCRWMDRFKYFCGIVWNQVTAVDAVTTTKAALEGAFHTAESLEEFEIDAWKRGVDVGYRRLLKDSDEDGGHLYTKYELDDIRHLSYNEGYSRSYQDTWNQVHERYPHLLDGSY